MLKKSIRVSKNLFDEIKKTKPKLVLKTNSLSFKYYTYPSKHFAVVVSKKTISRANKRVKIKRLIKRYLQEIVNDLPSGVYIFIVTSPGILNKTYEEISTEVNSVLSKVH